MENNTKILDYTYARGDVVVLEDLTRHRTTSGAWHTDYEASRQSNQINNLARPLCAQDL
jgi:hypothetical protein